MDDPYTVLGVSRDADLKTIRDRWLALVRENHPDSGTAKGYPEYEVEVMTARLARINAAYDAIKPKFARREVWL